jgi:hypothetical protein
MVLEYVLFEVGTKVIYITARMSVFKELNCSASLYGHPFLHHIKKDFQNIIDF